jgi:peptidoglycan/xylan/chitin deacetylase (PgdA/CDA1 family)
MAALFGISGRAFADPPGIEITQWKHNKPGALTLTFDDGYAAQYSVGVAALNEHGLKGTFFVFTECASMCVPRHVSWDDWRSAAGAGHEIGSHSKTHPYLSTLSAAELEDEIIGSQEEIDGEITSQSCLTFAYPYGDFNQSAKAMVESTYIGARGIDAGLNSPPFDLYDANVWFPESVDGSLEYQADLAELSGAWMIAGFHGLDGTEYGPVTEEEFRQFLNHIVTKNLWIDTFGAVTRYIKERESAAISLISSSSTEMVLGLTDDLDDNLYDQELTIRSEVPETCISAVVTQGSKVKTIDPVWEGSTKVIYFDAVPDRGHITVSFSTEPTEPALSSLAVTPASVVGGSPAQGTVILSAPAPSGGAVIALSDNSTAVSVPASVAVPSGSSSATFQITTSSVANITSVNISAAYDGTNRTATLTLAPATIGQVLSLTLVNAAADQDIGLLSNGGVINLAVTGTSLNVRANVSGSVGSVRFGLDGNTDYRTESAAPYALAGDNGGDYTSWSPALGSHSLTATPYSGAGATGTAGVPISISFTVINEPQINRAPEITAGPQASLNPVTLPGTAAVSVTASDADGDALIYSWSKTAGPGTVSFTNSAAASTTAAFSEAGDYTLKVVVSDGKASVNGSVSLNVLPEPDPPTPDIDGDGDVDGGDLHLFILAYGKSSGSPGFDVRCDFDLNDTVGPVDLQDFAAEFGD